MKTKLEKYGFIDREGHRLERCQDYLDIVDALERMKKFVDIQNWLVDWSWDGETIEKLLSAIEKTIVKKVENPVYIGKEIMEALDNTYLFLKEKFKESRQAIAKVLEEEDENKTEKTIELDNATIIIDGQTLGETGHITLSPGDKIKEISLKDLPSIKQIKKPEFKYYILKLTDIEMNVDNLRKFSIERKLKRDTDYFYADTILNIERTDTLNCYINESSCSEQANMLVIAIADWILKYDLKLSSAWRNVFEIIVNMAKQGGFDC